MPILESAVNGLWKKTRRSQGELLCLAALNQARSHLFYQEWGIPDTLEGRFDCACLHIALLLKHIHGSLAQAVFDSFFAYTELTLREVGVSDLRVGKQVQKCAKFFYGAMKSYHEALDQKIDLKEALFRNLFGGLAPSSIQKVVEYVKSCDHLLKEQDLEKSQSIQWPE